MSSPIHIGHKYTHYKNKDYIVVGTALHTETRKTLVLYKPLYECEIEVFARPLDMFSESVTIDGVTQPRFKHIGPYDEST